MTAPSAPRRSALATILVVDDLADNLLALSALLRRDGVEIHTASSGREALELLQLHDFAVAILDVKMPGMDGFELAELMRADPRTRKVPIILVTAMGRDAERRFHGFEAGAVDFFFKPIDAKILRHKVTIFLELYSQRAELEETLRLNEEMVAIVTHDLRSPLTTVLMLADSIAARSVEPAISKQAARMQRTTRQLLATVTDLLDLSRARLARGIPILRAWIDLHALFARVVEDLASTQPTRDVGLESLPGNFEGLWDGARLEQVLQNLVGNALTHGEHGTAVRVTLRALGDDVSFDVESAGTIPAHLLPRLFEPFASGAVGARSAGLGLGLYIVERVVHAHGGTITVESAGRTRFRVCLPRGTGLVADPVPSAHPE